MLIEVSELQFAPESMLQQSPYVLIPDWVWTLPSGAGSLIGAIIGALAIAATALFGLWQFKRQTVLDREARVHQADIERRMEAERRQQDARTLAAGLRGELEIAYVMCANFVNHYGILALWSPDPNESQIVCSSVPLWPNIPRDIYSANAMRIGLLESSYARDLSYVYTRIAAWPCQEQNWVKLETAEDEQEFGERAEQVEFFMKDLGQVIRRLRALEEGGSDPGPLKDVDVSSHFEVSTTRLNERG